jgi:hypothetical protein
MNWFASVISDMGRLLCAPEEVSIGGDDVHGNSVQAGN